MSPSSGPTRGTSARVIEKRTKRRGGGDETRLDRYVKEEDIVPGVTNVRELIASTLPRAHALAVGSRRSSIQAK